MFQNIKNFKKYNVPQVVISNIGFLTDSLRSSKNEVFNSFYIILKK